MRWVWPFLDKPYVSPQLFGDQKSAYFAITQSKDQSGTKKIKIHFEIHQPPIFFLRRVLLVGFPRKKGVKIYYVYKNWLILSTWNISTNSIKKWTKKRVFFYNALILWIGTSSVWTCITKLQVATFRHAYNLYQAYKKKNMSVFYDLYITTGSLIFNLFVSKFY